MKKYDIIIVGSGIVGLSTALALSKNPILKIAVLDRSLTSTHARVSALSLGSKRFFEALGVWESLDVIPYQRMFVWDENSKGEIEFNCSDIQQSALGFIVEDKLIRNALLEKLKEKINIELLAPVSLEKLTLSGQATVCGMTTAEHSPFIFSCQLIVGADGAQSWVREQAKIQTITTDYQHKAITAEVTTELPHQHTAWQCFSSQGPLAFLPLQNSRQSSIVWSTENKNADELLALTDEQFQNKLSDIFRCKLGSIVNTRPRSAFPLKMQHAKNYILPHLALIGDAAHTLHPLAGQGVNLGLQDAACLASHILSALEKKRDYSDWMTLRKYERERKSENTIMLKTVDGLKSLFASEKKFVTSLRSGGLNLINKTGFIKNFLASYAIGH